MLTANHKLEFKPGKRTAKTIVEAGTQLEQPTPGRLPRITKMMALAIRLDHLIKSGQVTDQAELARVGHVTRARLTQIMSLLYLSPPIQEKMLYLIPSKTMHFIDEKRLRTIASEVDWREPNVSLARRRNPSNHSGRLLVKRRATRFDFRLPAKLSPKQVSAPDARLGRARDPAKPFVGYRTFNLLRDPQMHLSRQCHRKIRSNADRGRTNVQLAGAAHGHGGGQTRQKHRRGNKLSPYRGKKIHS